MTGRSSEAKREEWKRRVSRFDRQKKSVGEFCQQEGVSVWSFYRWRKRLADLPTQPRKHRKKAIPKPPSPPVFQSISVTGELHSPLARVRLASGRELEVLDERALDQVLTRLLQEPAESRRC